MSKTSRLLNLGCGKQFDSRWRNIDIVPSSAQVEGVDIRKGLPFPDGTFDFVYHSHVLEHLAHPEAQSLIGECFRILKPRGQIRVVVPDLETIGREYLRSLDSCLDGTADSESAYDWIMLELVDQLTRHQSGGAMARYLQQSTVPNLAYIEKRIGAEVRSIMRPLQEKDTFKNTALWSLLRKIKRGGLNPKELLLRLLLGREYQALTVGRFRLGGEVHRWMYDRYSLKRLLEMSGFVETVRRSATSSYLSDWATYHLDLDENGNTRKPDSLFMEGVKPGNEKTHSS